MTRSQRQWSKVRRTLLNFIRYRLKVTVTWKWVRVVAIVMGLVVLGWVGLQSNVFQVRKITFTDAQWSPYVRQEVVLDELKRAVRKQSIFTVSVQSVADQLIAAEPFISKATITKSLPGTIYVSIQTELPAVAVYGQETCQILNSEGKLLREPSLAECSQYPVPIVTNSPQEQVYYSSVYIAYVSRFTELLRANNQELPSRYEFTNRPHVEIIAHFSDHAVRLAVDRDVLYNYLVYSSIRSSLDKRLLRSKTLDLTAQEPFLY